jgi:hypothetical protein
LDELTIARALPNYLNLLFEPSKEGFVLHHKLLKSLALLLAVTTLVGCGNSVAETTRTPAVQADKPTKGNPLAIDVEDREVSVYATVNGKYLTEPTRHGMNFREGKIGDKSLFVSYANVIDFQDAMVELEARRGNLNDEGYVREGTKMDISVTWDGAEREYALGEVVRDSTGKELDYQYSGTFKNAVRKFTGCMMCFDSCNVGVTSNSSHPKGITEDPEADVAVRGKPDVLPDDGTPVIVTFALKG